MGLFAQRPKTYAPPPQNALPPTFLGQSPSTASATNGRTAVAVDLPGLQETTYLDSEFAPRIDAFIKHAREAGHELTFSSGYRTPEKQKIHGQQHRHHAGAQ